MQTKIRFDILTLFPAMFDALNYSITARAQKADILELHYWNPRDYTQNIHHCVDDRPYGGGPGMVMQVQPLRDTLAAAKTACDLPAKVIYLSPQGTLLTQPELLKLSQQPRLILLAGRYEGIDQRFIDRYVDEEWSIGDYVLSGGELAAMVMIDAITRLLPDVLGNAQSAVQDSFTHGLLDCPHYTRPRRIDGQEVPEILLSGHDQAIAIWRMRQALGQTWLKRKDLLAKITLTKVQIDLLNEFINGYHGPIKYKCDEEKHDD